MKRIFIAILTGSIFFMLCVLTAEVREKKSDNFLRINDNIQNEELRAELEGLRDEFNFERSRIHDYYSKKMEALKRHLKKIIAKIIDGYAKNTLSYLIKIGIILME